MYFRSFVAVTNLVDNTLRCHSFLIYRVERKPVFIKRSLVNAYNDRDLCLWQSTLVITAMPKNVK